MEQTAKVIKVNKNTATVEATRKSACASCHKSEEGCAACTLLGPDKKFRAEALNEAGAKIGDTVKIYTPDSTALGYAALIFLVPILAALALYYGADLMSLSDTVCYICGGVGFVLSILAVIIISKFKKTPSVVITEILTITHDSECENKN